MKVFNKVITVTLLCMSMLLGVTGCGNDALDGSQIVATVGEKEMTLGEANFLLRYQQVQTESYYESMFGEGIYAMDLYGDGSTFGDNFKDDVMDQLYEYYVLEAKASEYGVELTEEETAAITEAATAFLDANETATEEQMTADQATVERVLSLMTLRSKMKQAIYAEADVTVTDDEAATESEKETLMQSKQSEYMSSLLSAWKEELTLTVNEDVWAEVVFDRSYDLAN